MPLCPVCGCQNLEEAEICISCQTVLKGKECISCGEKIPVSAKVCPKCGKSQEPEIIKPWVCNICGTKNDPMFDDCTSCGAHKGEENHLTVEYLCKHSNKNDLLSIEDCSIELANGVLSTPIKVQVYEVEEALKSNNGTKSLPIFTDKTDLSSLSIFVNPNQRIYKQCKIKVKQMVAEEIAEFIFRINRSVTTKDGTHTIPYIAWQIIEKYWADRMEGSTSDLSSSVEDVVKIIKEKLILSAKAELGNYFDLLSSEQQKELVNEIINAGEDISKLSEYRMDGTYLKYAPASFLVHLFEVKPEIFFDGAVWDEKYSESGIGEDVTVFMQERTKALYKGCLEDVLFYIKYKSPSEMVVQKTMLAVELLKQKVAE